MISLKDAITDATMCQQIILEQYKKTRYQGKQTYMRNGPVAKLVRTIWRNVTLQDDYNETTHNPDYCTRVNNICKAMFPNAPNYPTVYKAFEKAIKFKWLPGAIIVIQVLNFKHVGMVDSLGTGLFKSDLADILSEKLPVPGDIEFNGFINEIRTGTKKEITEFIMGKTI